MGELNSEALVLSKCKDLLKKLEFMGWVRHWDRVSVGLHMNMQGFMQKHGKAGTPDIQAFVPIDDTMWVMFFEIKRPDGGIQSLAQQAFEKKFLGFNNVIYQIITDHKQIKETIDNTRKKSNNYGKLEQWELPESIG